MRTCLSKIISFMLALTLLVSAAAEQNSNDTQALKLRLKELGFLSTSESYEGETELYYAVFNFQKANGIPASGIVDPTTSESIFSADAISFSEYIEQYCRPADTDISLSFRDSGRQVRQLQQELKALDYYAGETSGDYDMETACAVALFETVNGFEPDGLADSEMMGRLLSPSAIALSGFENMESLSFGDRGVYVKYAQALLKKLGYFGGECSGEFGKSTQNAVISFEQRNGFEPTGNWTVLYTVMAKNNRAVDKAGADVNESKLTLKSGDKGYLVRELKQRLSELGYYNGAVDDEFDERTYYAVITFQEASGLLMTGEADAETRRAILDEAAPSIDDFKALCEVSALSYGQSGYGVYLMTKRLQALGYPIEVSREFNEQVKSAVTVFQYAEGYEASDLVSAEQRKTMNSSTALNYSEAKRLSDEKEALMAKQSSFEDFMSLVRATIGTPYEAGQTGPESFGIGGLCYYLYGLMDIEMPPTAALQLESATQAGRFLDDKNSLVPGAQVFFRLDDQLCAGIVTNSGSFIYASREDGKVIERSTDDLFDELEFVGLVIYFDAV